MRILINATSTRGGGGATVTAELAHALATDNPNDELELLVNDSDQEFVTLANAPNLRVRRVRGVQNPLSRFAWEQTILRRTAKAHDVVIGLAGFGPIASSNPQVLVAQNALYFDVPPGTSTRSRLKAALRFLYFRASGTRNSVCVAVSDLLAETVASRTTIRRNRIVVARNASAAPRGARPRPPCAGKDEGPKRVLWVGSRSAHKNVRDFEFAISILKESLDIGAFAAGIGPHGGAAHETPGGVLHLGPLSRDDVYLQMQLADLVVVTSAIESSSLVPIEASSMYRPVVASDIPPHREVLDRRCLYPLGDVHALADAIRSFAEGRDDCGEIVDANFRNCGGASWIETARVYRNAADMACQASL